MNSRTKHHQNKLACALGGPNTDDQFDVLDKMLDFLNNFRVLHSTTGKIRIARMPWEQAVPVSLVLTSSFFMDLYSVITIYVFVSAMMLLARMLSHVVVF